MKRTIVYVDGFNLYYGALKRTPDKWLDLAAYFQALRPSDDLRAVRYFTALVTGQAGVDQRTYLDALATTSLVRVTLGKYKSKTLRCTVASCRHGEPREFHRWEEKQTDVNIGLAMLDDAYQQGADQMVLVSGDSDLVPAIDLVKLRAPHIRVIVYLPDRRAWLQRADSTARNVSRRPFALELRASADEVRLLPIIELGRAQLAPSLAAVDGSVLMRPADW